MTPSERREFEELKRILAEQQRILENHTHRGSRIDRTKELQSAVPTTSNDTEVIFNDGGELGSDANFTYDKTSQTLTVAKDGNEGTVGVSDSSSANTAGGNFIVKAGGANGTGTGGDLDLTAGNADSSGAGGEARLFAGNGQGTGVGGDVLIEAGDGGGSGSGNGGDINLEPGSGNGLRNGRVATQMAAGDGASYRLTGQTTTTNNTFTSVGDKLTPASSSGGYIRARVIGRRTGGSAGTANDTAVYEIVQGVKNNAGTITLVGALTSLFTYEDNVNCDVQFAVSGSDIVLQVKGDTNNNYKWNYEMWYFTV